MLVNTKTPDGYYVDSEGVYYVPSSRADETENTEETYPNSSDSNTSQGNSNSSNQSDDKYANDMLEFMRARDRVIAEMGMREKAGDN